MTAKPRKRRRVKGNVVFSYTSKQRAGMSMDRTKMPPGYTIDCDCVYLDTMHHSSIVEAHDEYDRITLPARIALLRELAEEMREQGVAPNAQWYRELLRRADALEKDTP